MLTREFSADIVAKVLMNFLLVVLGEFLVWLRLNHQFKRLKLNKLPSLCDIEAGQ